MNFNRGKRTTIITAVSCLPGLILTNVYTIGCWFLQEARKVGVAQKLEPRYGGPFLVTSMPSPINVTIQLAKDGQQKTVHHDKLKGALSDLFISYLSAIY